ncbi:MAG: AMP-binding protein [Mycobacteriales bacterium]
MSGGQPLSRWQHGAWLRARLDAAAGLQTARALRVTGPLDVDALRRRLVDLADRHPELAGRCVDTDAGPVLLPGAAPLLQVDAAGSADLVAEAVAPVDMAAGPLLRVRVHRLGPAEHVLLVLPHPVAVDPSALPGLVRALLTDDPPPWSPQPPPVPARRPATVPPLGLGSGRRGLELRRGVTVPVAPVGAVRVVEAVLAAVALLLRRYTGVGEVGLGLAMPGGSGLLRADLTGDPTVGQVVADVLQGVRAARHARPSDGGTAEVAVAVDALLAPGEPAWGAAVALGESGEPAPFGDLAAAPVALQRRAVPGDLLVTVRTAGGGPRVALVADPAAVPPGLVRWLAEDLPAVLAAVTAEPGGRASAVLPCPAAERRPDGPPRADAAFPAAELERSIPARFADVVRCYPDRPAVLADDGALSYAELARAAAGVTAAVRAVPPPGDGDRGRVALLLDHGVTMVTAIVGAVCAGRAYVPLDPGFPLDRLAGVLADAEPDVVLTTAALRPLAAELLGRAGRTAAVLDLPGLSGMDGAGPSDVDGDTPAYVLYTSGSTGRPKGVVQSHRGVLFQARNHALSHAVGAEDRVSVLTSFGFDPSVTDLFTALLTGAAAVPVDVRRHGLGHLAAALVDRGVTVYHSTPTLYRFLLGSLGRGTVLDRIRVVLLGGEELTRRDVEAHRRHFGPGSLLVNGYGATEVSFALQERVSAAFDGDRVPIGRPLDGLDVLLLAPDGQPACLAGEIAVRGRYVALGYRGGADSGRFGDLGDGIREYRTGDLGRRLPDGRIAYAGRRDRQVKVRGYRVELGEVEAALARRPGVAQAAAVARTEEAGGTTELLGYVVPAAGAVLDGRALRAELAAELPHYAVPRAVVVLDALPLTPTGKVDTRSLPVPARDRSDGSQTDPLRRLVAAAWCAELGVESVRADETFFEAGGHSLLLARVQRRLERELGRAVPLHRLFEHPTVAGQARWLADTAAGPDGTGTGPDAGAGTPADARLRDRMDRRRDARGRRGPRPAGGRGVGVPR